jgi:hypothetical protein
VKVLHKKINDPKHKMRVLLEPNVQKLIKNLKITYKGLGYYFQTFTPKKMPHPPFHMEKEGGAKVGFKE